MRHYRFDSTRSLDESLNRVAILLIREGVTIQKQSHSIKSIRTPVVFLGFDRRLYTKGNWVGINPFVFISGVEVKCSETTQGGTEIDIVVDQRRTSLIYFLALINVFVVASVLPNHELGILLFVVAGAALFFLLFKLIGYQLVTHQIRNEIEPPSTG